MLWRFLSQLCLWLIAQMIRTINFLLVKWVAFLFGTDNASLTNTSVPKLCNEIYLTEPLIAKCDRTKLQVKRTWITKLMTFPAALVFSVQKFFYELSGLSVRPWVGRVVSHSNSNQFQIFGNQMFDPCFRQLCTSAWAIVSSLKFTINLCCFQELFKKAPNQQKEQEIHPITENPNRTGNKI